MRSSLRKLITTFCLTVVFALPSAVLTSYIFKDSFHTLAAIYAFYTLEKPRLSRSLDFEGLKTRTQKFFLLYGITIHSSDIIHAKTLQNDALYHFQPKGCLENAVIAYIPVQVRYPWYGIKTYEWCLVIL